jgi:hypothetical protein
MKRVIRVYIALVDLVNRRRLKPITKAVDLRTMISVYIAQTGCGHESLTSE